jgi:predicted metal-dependent hydrolase
MPAPNTSSTYPQPAIHVRRMDFEFTDDIPEHWANDNAVLTAVMAGLSAAFPPGERYFIESVKHYADQVSDPVLKERIRGFVGQEANHTKEHLAFNEFLDGRGMPVGKMQRFVEARLKSIKKMSSPAQNLARTVALEHLTAFLASALIENSTLLEHTHPTIAAFWAWHAIEEIEHRSVAFDVYKQHVDDEWLRLRAMAGITVIFSAVTVLRTLIVLKSTGNLLNLPAWTRGLDLLFGRQGMVRKSFPLYRAYYRSSFHPDQHDNLDALERAKSMYLSTRAA